MHGDGREEDLERIGVIDKTLQNANCLHGQFTPYAVRGLVNYFRDELDTHIADKRDPARVAPGLTRYLITDQSDPRLEQAAELCPTSCISRAAVEPGEDADESDGDVGEALGDWQIHAPSCIHCDVCREVAPEAIRVEDRFAAMLSVI